jgi:FG-GAP-like repeat
VHPGRLRRCCKRATGKGDGTFQSATAHGSGDQDATSLAVGDVNSDGKPDIVVSNYCVFTGENRFPFADSVGVLLGKGDGTFQNTVTYNAGGFTASSVALADLDGDGALDRIVTSECGPSLDTCSNNGLVGVLAGNGDGTFQPFVTYNSGGVTAGSLVATDVRGDGRPNLRVANLCATSAYTGNGLIGVLLNNSTSFGLVPNPATVTISAPGQSGSVTITIIANGNLNPKSLTNWSCSGLPKASNCTFGTIDDNNQISLMITTGAASHLQRPFSGHRQACSTLHYFRDFSPLYL